MNPLAKIFDTYHRDAPIVLLDVGAGGGLNRNWLPIKTYLFKIFVEPEENAYRKLLRNSDKKTLVLNVPLYKDKRVINFYTCKKRKVSSLYPPNKKFLDEFPDAERFDVLSITKLKAEALDTIFENNIAGSDARTIDFIKLDTQGSELDILYGAEKILKKNVLGLEVEVEFAELYSGQHLFEEVHKYLKAHNFELFNLQNTLHWRKQKFFGKGQIISADAIYFKNIAACIDELRDATPRLAKMKIIKYMTLCDLYQQFDRAYELFSKFSNLFTKEEKGSVNSLYQKRYFLTVMKTPSRLAKAPRKIFTKIISKIKR